MQLGDQRVQRFRPTQRQRRDVSRAVQEGQLVAPAQVARDRQLSQRDGGHQPDPERDRERPADIEALARACQPPDQPDERVARDEQRDRDAQRLVEIRIGEVHTSPSAASLPGRSAYF